MTKGEFVDKINRNTAENIIAKLAEKAKNADGIDNLWTSPASLKRHITQREGYSHIEDLQDYRKKIINTLNTATHYSIAVSHLYPLVEITNKDWSVILNHLGEIKTAYKIELNKPSFTDNQLRLKYNVYEYEIRAGIKQKLRGLFNAR